MHQRTRFISFLLVVSILLSTLYLPIVAEDTAVPEAVSPAISSVPETVSNAPAELIQGIPVDLESEAILKHVDQDAFRTANHTLRLPKEESLNTYVYMNDNGTKTVYFMDENVKYVDKEGNIQEKDISLKETKNGFTTVKNDVSVFIPTNAANGIQVSHSIGNVKLIPQNSLLVVAGRQDGDSVLYPNYFGKGICLRYTPLLSGVKEDIILASYTGTHSFQFALETNGLFVYEDASGYYVAASADAEERYALGEIIVYDAVGRPSMGSMTVKTITAGRRYVLTVSADLAFLTDADTVYPVTIDPTITVNGQTDASLIWDVPIFSGYPTWTCGAYQYLTLGNAGGNYGTGRAVVKLPGLYQSSIYQSLTAEQILDVSFYCSDGSGNASQYVSLYPHMGSTTWTESNASWNSIGMYESGYDYGTQVAHGVFTKFDITELVQLWKSSLFFEGAGFILVNADEVTREKHKAIHATEYATASYRPYVVFTYSPRISEERVVITVNETKALSVLPQLNDSMIWYSSDSTVATVSTTGVVTGKKLGTTVITASSITADGEPYLASCTVHVCPIREGVYFIKNKQSGYYADIKNQVMTNGTTIHQWQYHGGSTQKWIFTYLNDGYYSIKSTNSTASYYLGVINDSTGLNVDIVLRSGALTDGMKWKISTTDSGAYRLTPKTGESSDYALATTSSTATNGAKLIQGAYLYNNSYCDEWTLIPPYKTVLYGVTNANHDHISSLNNIIDMDDMTAVTLRTGAISAATCKNDLQNYNIFLSRSHGGKILSDAVCVATAILLNDSSPQILFASHSWNGMNSSSVSIEQNESYANLKIAVFIGCETASGRAGANNLPTRIVQQGASVAVGFNGNIGCNTANAWAEEFYKSLLAGNSVEEAVKDAQEETLLTSAVICGDKNTKLYS